MNKTGYPHTPNTCGWVQGRDSENGPRAHLGRCGNAKTIEKENVVLTEGSTDGPTDQQSGVGSHVKKNMIKREAR